MDFAPIREFGWKVKKDLTWGMWRFKKYTKPVMKGIYIDLFKWALLNKSSRSRAVGSSSVS